MWALQSGSALSDLEQALLGCSELCGSSSVQQLPGALHLHRQAVQILLRARQPVLVQVLQSMADAKPLQLSSCMGSSTQAAACPHNLQQLQYRKIITKSDGCNFLQPLLQQAV